MYSKKSTLKKMSKKPVKRSKSRLNVKKRKVNSKSRLNDKKRKVNSKRVTTKRKTKRSNKKSRKSQKKQFGGEGPHGHSGDKEMSAYFSCENIIKKCNERANTCQKSELEKCKNQGYRGNEFGR